MAWKNVENNREKFGAPGKRHRIFPDGNRILGTNAGNCACGPLYDGGAMVLSGSFAAGGDVAADLELLVGETLVEVLRIWDCDAQCWAADGPIVVRMETIDLAVWADSAARLRTYLGGVRTELPVLAWRSSPENFDRTSPAICWLPDASYERFAGSQIEVAPLLRDVERGFGAITLRLESGWEIDLFSVPDMPGLLDIQARPPHKRPR